MCKRIVRELDRGTVKVSALDDMLIFCYNAAMQLRTQLFKDQGGTSGDGETATISERYRLPANARCIRGRERIRFAAHAC
ncbi:MAG: hypothetical protein NVS2B12_11830 [Ktedonobacteraceae bacterium]